MPDPDIDYIVITWYDLCEIIVGYCLIVTNISLITKLDGYYLPLAHQVFPNAHHDPTSNDRGNGLNRTLEHQKVIFKGILLHPNIQITFQPELPCTTHEMRSRSEYALVFSSFSPSLCRKSSEYFRGVLKFEQHRTSPR